MLTILKEIYNHKVNLVELVKKKISKKDLILEIDKSEKTRGFINKINNNINNNFPSIIAEIKKASPSKGIIRENFNPKEIATLYQKGQASCISVLTDSKYFMGTNNDLTEVKKVTNLPILRKDFIVSDYQIYESRAIGADCILLISEILNKGTIKSFISLAKELSLDVIIEVHEKKYLNDYLTLDDVLIGINNRNLNNMDVNINHSIKLTKNMNNKNNIICESGINSFKNFQRLVEKGFKIFLIGEYLMKSNNPYKDLLNLSTYKKTFRAN